jgi:CheY-like chemotaxis protein/HPt (histidine-containing phosphotransfer) domain-containing protein
LPSDNLEQVFRDPRIDLTARHFSENYMARIEYFRVGDDLPVPGDKAFRVTLLDVPIKWQDFRNRALDVIHRDTSGRIDTDDVDRPLHNLRFLGAEDNHINRFTIRELLSEAGAICTMVEDGKLAIEMLQTTSFDAVLMDIQMPVMDGITAVKILRKDPRFESIPIIALTAAISDLTEMKKGDEGFTACLVKPLDVQALVEIVEQFYNQKKQSAFVSSRLEKQNTDLAFDPNICLSATNNNQTLCRRILNEFVTHYTELSHPADVIDPSKENLQEFRLYYHTLRGLAGMAGALKLQETAATIEDRIIKTDALPDRTAIETCRDALADCCRAIAEYLTEIQDAAPQTVTPVPTKTKALLSELLSSVQVGRANVYDMSLQLPLELSSAPSIQACLKEFDFDAAEHLIKAELANLEAG